MTIPSRGAAAVAAVTIDVHAIVVIVVIRVPLILMSARVLLSREHLCQPVPPLPQRFPPRPTLTRNITVSQPPLPPRDRIGILILRFVSRFEVRSRKTRTGMRCLGARGRSDPGREAHVEVGIVGRVGVVIERGQVEADRVQLRRRRERQVAQPFNDGRTVIRCGGKMLVSSPGVVVSSAELNEKKKTHVVCSRYSLELLFSILFLGTSSLNSGPKYSRYSLNGRSAPISTPAASPVSNAHVRATFRTV